MLLIINKVLMTHNLTSHDHQTSGGLSLSFLHLVRKPSVVRMRKQANNKGLIQ